MMDFASSMKANVLGRNHLTDESCKLFYINECMPNLYVDSKAIYRPKVPTRVRQGECHLITGQRR